VKRPLPTRHVPIGKLQYVDFANMDTRYRQTAWREREREVLMLKRFSEMNVKLDVDKNPTAGSLGPKLSTRYDYSTRRMVPTDYDMVPDQEIKNYLQAQARLGTAPVYPHKMADNASLSVISGYSVQPDIRYNYRTMSEKRFEKYIEEVRGKRESFKDFLAAQAANVARARVAQQYNNKKEDVEKQSNVEGSIVADAPEDVAASSLPLLKRTEEESDTSIYIDLWDEARLVDAERKPWEPWLKSQNTSPTRQADSQLLPLQFNRKGGHEIPTPLHVHGGLQYGQPDVIATQLLYGSLPARALGQARDPDYRSKKLSNVGRSSPTQEIAVALGGRIATMKRIYSNFIRPVDVSGNEPKQGNTRVKVVSAARVMDKVSVDQPLFLQRLSFTNSNDSRLPPQYGNTVLEVRASEAADETSMAKGIPGSTEWIARRDGSLRSSGQGYQTTLDYTNMDRMSANYRRLDIDSDRRYANSTPGDRARRQKKDRLSGSSVSSQRKVADLWEGLNEAIPMRRGARKSKVSPYRPEPITSSLSSSGLPGSNEVEADAAEKKK
jgi:hypothetical protein